MNQIAYLDRDNNPLMEYGQRPTPAAGAAIQKIIIGNDDHNGYFDRIKDRYVWMPLHDIPFIGTMAKMPMSTQYIYRGRISWIQPVSYKAVDNSVEAWDSPGEEELNLKTFVLTPFAQCVYLHLNYAEKGLKVFEHLKNESPELVQYIEQLILPDVPMNLIELGDYLTLRSSQAIQAAGLDKKTYELAVVTLSSMIEGTNQAITYARNLISETEGEMLTRANKGVGKASFDMNDRYAYTMLKRPIPKEATLENTSEARTHEILESLTKAISKANNIEVPKADDSANRIAELETKLIEMQAQFAEALKNLPQAPPSVPVVEETTVVPDELVQNDLKNRLNKKR